MLEQPIDVQVKKTVCITMDDKRAHWLACYVQLPLKTNEPMVERSYRKELFDSIIAALRGRQ